MGGFFEGGCPVSCMHFGNRVAGSFFFARIAFGRGEGKIYYSMICKIGFFSALAGTKLHLYVTCTGVHYGACRMRAETGTKKAWSAFLKLGSPRASPVFLIPDALGPLGEAC